MTSEREAWAEQLSHAARELFDALPTAQEAGEAIVAIHQACPPTEEELALYEWRLSPEGTRWAERERMRLLNREG